jgi:hypothetical protein
MVLVPDVSSFLNMDTATKTKYFCQQITSPGLFIGCVCRDNCVYTSLVSHMLYKTVLNSCLFSHLYCVNILCIDQIQMHNMFIIFFTYFLMSKEIKRKHGIEPRTPPWKIHSLDQLVAMTHWQFCQFISEAKAHWTKRRDRSHHFPPLITPLLKSHTQVW